MSFRAGGKRRDLTEPSGCEDCDFLDIKKYLGDFPDMYICGIRVWDCETGTYYLANTHNSLDFVENISNNDNLTHIEPPDWCPGG